jgi:hypothetical protein
MGVLLILYFPIEKLKIILLHETMTSERQQFFCFCFGIKFFLFLLRISNIKTGLVTNFSLSFTFSKSFFFLGEMRPQLRK